MPIARALLVATAISWAIHHPIAAQRRVDGHRLVSDSQPAAGFVFDSNLTYLGTQSFPLYGVAQAEQHFFGQLEGNRLKRFVWVQFEGYLPDNAHTYDYSRFPTVVVSGHSFHHNEQILTAEPPAPRPGSDGAKMREFVRDHGWQLPVAALYQRLVWLVDEPARHEVMIIYIEDLQGVEPEKHKMLLALLPGRATSTFRIED